MLIHSNGHRIERSPPTCTCPPTCPPAPTCIGHTILVEPVWRGAGVAGWQGAELRTGGCRGGVLCRRIGRRAARRVCWAGALDGRSTRRLWDRGRLLTLPRGIADFEVQHAQLTNLGQRRPAGRGQGAGAAHRAQRVVARLRQAEGGGSRWGGLIQQHEQRARACELA